MILLKVLLTLVGVITLWRYRSGCECCLYCFALFHVWLDQHDNIVLFLLVDLLGLHVWLLSLPFLRWVYWNWLVHNAYCIACTDFFWVSSICSMRLHSWRLTVINHAFAWRPLSSGNYFRLCMATPMEWIRIDLSDVGLLLVPSTIRCSEVRRRLAGGTGDRWLIRRYNSTSDHTEVCCRSASSRCSRILQSCWSSVENFDIIVVRHFSDRLLHLIDGLHSAKLVILSVRYDLFVNLMGRCRF